MRRRASRRTARRLPPPRFVVDRRNPQVVAEDSGDGTADAGQDDQGNQGKGKDKEKKDKKAKDQKDSTTSTTIPVTSETAPPLPPPPPTPPAPPPPPTLTEGTTTLLSTSLAVPPPVTTSLSTSQAVSPPATIPPPPPPPPPPPAASTGSSSSQSTSVAQTSTPSTLETRTLTTQIPAIGTFTQPTSTTLLPPPADVTTSQDSVGTILPSTAEDQAPSSTTQRFMNSLDGTPSLATPTGPAYTTTDLPMAIKAESSLNPGQIAGIVIGSLALLLLAAAAIITLLRRRRCSAASALRNISPSPFQSLLARMTPTASPIPFFNPQPPLPPPAA
ncbi:hypothetical protein C8A05DRAFT_39736, partial [Staphylotrichum tortipilum]